MSSLIQGYAYDIFVSYRQKDNRYDGWVTDFVENLRKELEATFKEEVSVYFDANPHDYLLETHDVDQTVDGKINCLILLPVISQTYCDPGSFAWKSELVPFVQRAATDRFGLTVKLPSGNVARRVIPIKIHEIESADARLLSTALRGELRYIDFTYHSPGVNRPLRVKDDEIKSSADQLMYRDQINKTANAIKELIFAIKRQPEGFPVTGESTEDVGPDSVNEAPLSFIEKIKQRRIPSVAILYTVIALIIIEGGRMLGPGWGLSAMWTTRIGWILLVLAPIPLALAWNFEFGPQGLVRTDAGTSTSNPYHPSRRKPFTSTMVIGLLLIVLISQTIYFRWNAWTGNFQTSSTIESNSIAVLPLKNMSDKLDNEYFSDGLTEDIITQLSKISSLRVISRASIIAYKNRKESLQDIAEALGVAKILEGSVQVSGNAMRVRVELIDVIKNDRLWAETFDRDLGDVFALQSEMARDIAQAMKANLSDLEQTALSRKPTNNVEAYDFYLRGREYYYRYERESNDKAIGEFKKAVALDPEFALAWAGLGDAYSQMFGRFGQEAFWIDSSLFAGRKAVALDSNLSEGYKALANAHNYTNQYDQAFALLQKAVSLNPNNAQAVGNLGTGYFFKNELDKALKWEKKAAALNPRSFIPFQIVGWIYRLLGEHENAEQWLLRSLELRPFRDTYEQLALSYFAQGKKADGKALIPKVLQLGEDFQIMETAGLIAFMAGDFESAKGYFRKSVDLHTGGSDPDAISPIYLGHILLREGNKVDSEVFLTNSFDLRMEEMKMGSQDDELAFYLAGIAATQGKTEQAIKWLKVAKGRNWIDYSMALHNPLFASIHNHPEFVAIIEDIKQTTEKMRP